MASKNPELYQKFFTTPSKWHQSCPTIHSGCSDGWGQKPDSYIKVRYFVCTNDITKAPVEMQVK